MKRHSPRRYDYWVGTDGEIHTGKPDEHGKPPYQRDLTDDEWVTHLQLQENAATQH